MRRWVLALGLALVVSTVTPLPSPAAGGDDAVGSVVAVRGEVKATGPQGERLLAMKSPVFQSDRLRTGKGARIQLLFKDNTIISLGENSLLEIAGYEWDAGKQSGAMKTRIEEGTFRVLGGMITKTSPKNFTTETPAATIGIRGSMYAGAFRENQLQVAFTGGRGIYVVNPFGRVEIDQPGFGTRVTAGSPPQPPARMTGPELAGLVEGLGNGGDAGGPSRVAPLSPENADLLGFEPGTGTEPMGTLPGAGLLPEVPATRTNDILSEDVQGEATKPGPMGHPYIP